MTLFDNYNQLLDKLDAHLAHVHQQYNTHIMCKKSCIHCCVANIRIWTVEHDFISQNKNPNTCLKESNASCAWLNQNGHCQIYNCRPIVCRLWGYPILYSDTDYFQAIQSTTSNAQKPDQSQFTVCNHNFKSFISNNNFPSSAIIDSTRILTPLAVINQLYCKETNQNSNQRFLLSAC